MSFATAKVVYVVTCLALFTLVMGAIAYFVVRPMQEWLGPWFEANPLMTFVGVGALVPIWLGTYWWLRKTGRAT
jgi:hypothetical protein